MENGMAWLLQFPVGIAFQHRRAAGGERNPIDIRLLMPVIKVGHFAITKYPRCAYFGNFQWLVFLIELGRKICRLSLTRLRDQIP